MLQCLTFQPNNTMPNLEHHSSAYLGPLARVLNLSEAQKDLIVLNPNMKLCFTLRGDSKTSVPLSHVDRNLTDKQS